MTGQKVKATLESKDPAWPNADWAQVKATLEYTDPAWLFPVRGVKRKLTLESGSKSKSSSQLTWGKESIH